MIVNKKLILVLPILALALNCCTPKTVTQEEVGQSMNPDFLSTVRTAKAELSHRQETLTLSGKVEYDPEKVVQYFPLISGIIDKIYFTTGDKVVKGQPILDVRSTDLSALQSELSSLEAELKVSERELQTAHEMFNDNMLSEKELLGAESKLKQTKAALNKVRNDMQLFGPDKGNGVFSLKAPAAGYIMAKKTAPGSTISPDDEPLFTIVDLSTVWAIANVYAGNLQSVKEGMEVDFTTLSYPDEIFSGKIDRLSPTFDPEDKVLKARIVMPNKEMKLKPEMPIVIRLKDQTSEKMISIPSEALIFDNNRYYTVIKEGDVQFSIREVQLQGHNDKTSYVSSGLLEGDEVVVSGQLLIYSGLNEK